VSGLNVDAKCPFDDLVAYQEATSDLDKKKALKNFENAVKEKVRQITTRDYINPEDQTVDFVVMFIPNEMIFSFIYEKLPGMSEYCAERKVVLTGPFGFTALVRLVLQAYKNFQYEKGLHQILGLIEKFQGEYEKFGTSMQRLGAQIETARKTFDEVNTTRTKQLGRVVEKINEYSKQEKLPLSGNIESVNRFDEVEDVIERLGSPR
jgi:DNA recombination protein RmuC